MSAAQGDLNAQYQLGQMYEAGYGVRKDPDAARRLYWAAADQGSREARRKLGILSK